MRSEIGSCSWFILRWFCSCLCVWNVIMRSLWPLRHCKMHIKPNAAYKQPEKDGIAAVGFLRRTRIWTLVWKVELPGVCPFSGSVHVPNGSKCNQWCLRTPNEAIWSMFQRLNTPKPGFPENLYSMLDTLPTRSWEIEVRSKSCRISEQSWSFELKLSQSIVLMSTSKPQNMSFQLHLYRKLENDFDFGFEKKSFFFEQWERWAWSL